MRIPACATWIVGASKVCTAATIRPGKDEGFDLRLALDWGRQRAALGFV